MNEVDLLASESIGRVPPLDLVAEVRRQRTSDGVDACDRLALGSKASDSGDPLLDGGDVGRLGLAPDECLDQLALAFHRVAVERLEVEGATPEVREQALEGLQVAHGVASDR